jgi:hypothetical protein
VIETMAHAAGLITQRLPKARQAKPVWQKTAALLMEPHKSGKRSDIEAATTHLCRALIVEGWLKGKG